MDSWIEIKKRNIADLTKQYRKANKLTQKQLAEEVGVSASTISRIETETDVSDYSYGIVSSVVDLAFQQDLEQRIEKGEIEMTEGFFDLEVKLQNIAQHVEDAAKRAKTDFEQKLLEVDEEVNEKIVLTSPLDYVFEIIPVLQERQGLYKKFVDLSDKQGVKNLKELLDRINKKLRSILDL